MFLLLTAQLCWWLLFFHTTQKETRQIEHALDSERLRHFAHGEKPPADSPVACERECFIKPEVIAAREARHQRRLSMLISETLFVLSVLSYGSFRVIRSIHVEKKMNEDRITFLNSVTHELKTPVAAVQLMLQTIQKRALPEAQRQELTEEAIDSLRKLSTQIETLLLAGEIPRAAAADFMCNGSEAALSAVERHRKMGTEIFPAVTPDLNVRLPESLMSRLLDILVGNAALHGGPPVELGLAKQGSHAVLTVRDHGRGIPAGEEKLIFRPFHRASSRSGTGLGLYLARQIAHMASGSATEPVTAGNHPEGGAVFTVRLALTEKT